MDSVEIYSIAAGSVLTLLILYQILARLIMTVVPVVRGFWDRHVLYRYVLRRRRFFPGLSRAKFFFGFLYWTGNIISVCVSGISWQSVSVRTGNLALVNLLPLYCSSQLGYGADLLGLSLSTMKSIHRHVAIMVCVNALIHTIITLEKTGWQIRETSRLFGLFVR